MRESEFNLDPEGALSTLWTTLEDRGIRPGDLAGLPGLPGGEAGATAETWEATPLSDEEGLDGLDGADPADLDIESGPPSRRRRAGTDRLAR